MTELTLARAHCVWCDLDFVTAEQVDRWPHLARYQVGEVDGDGYCGRCSSEPSRAEPSLPEETLVALLCNPWISRAYRQQIQAQLDQVAAP